MKFCETFITFFIYLVGFEPRYDLLGTFVNRNNLKLITFTGARWFMERTSSFLTFIGTQPIQCEQTLRFFLSRNENFIFRFLISNTDHIIDVNKATAIHEYDTINIVCPKYSKNTDNEVRKNRALASFLCWRYGIWSFFKSIF